MWPWGSASTTAYGGVSSMAVSSASGTAGHHQRPSRRQRMQLVRSNHSGHMASSHTSSLVRGNMSDSIAVSTTARILTSRSASGQANNSTG
mmetsp:Transcript_9517/g.23253  ORF Transcript_9517/g.23253 Transcript_9517/m.23253 type:complete len:91 (-) Transcript_9517:234-506(-)